ncbi:WD40 repeat-like protein, partial [Rhizopogon salebrosus TDB-379]
KVISGSVDGRLRLWNVKEGSVVGDPWEGHSDAVRCLDWSPNTREIASGSEDGAIRRWNPNTGRQIAPPIETGHGYVHAVKYSPRGDKFASCGYDNIIRVWSKDGKLLIEIKGHEYPVNSLCWSKDGAYIFSGSGDMTTRKWQSIDGKEFFAVIPAVSDPSVCPPMNAIFSAHQKIAQFVSGTSRRMCKLEIHSCTMMNSWPLPFPPTDDASPVPE